ncbi:uncharacterized ENTR1 family protein isoform X2 [Musca domestica]|uniref:Uncharacterized SDCCAG3 family protein isoform X2 n=1 Tax=Musca domestica TaxID=7370 RepID=A0A1I8MDE6_MUSDO|nr:uncharacterized ENTR1 family protein isoform X2 [Musca domestica]
MTRRNTRRLARKQSRKSFRQNKKILRKQNQSKIGRGKAMLTRKNNVLPHDQVMKRDGPTTTTPSDKTAAQNNDDIPSPSRAVLMNNQKKSPQKVWKKSPLKAGYINKFQKFRDDKAKKLVKRSKMIMLDLTKSQNESSGGGGGRLYLNKSARKQMKSPKQIKRNCNLRNNRNNKPKTSFKAPNSSKGVDNKSQKEAPVHKVNKDNEKNKNDGDDDDDDCILIEKNSTQIIIDDDDDDSDDTTSSSDEEETKTNNKPKPPASSVPEYQSLFQSFSKRGSSTPLVKNQQRILPSKRRKINNNDNHFASNSPQQHLTFAQVAANNTSTKANDLFFVDVNSNAFLGNIKYIPRKPLSETSNSSNTKEAGKRMENGDDDDDVIVLDNDTTLKDSSKKSTTNHKTGNASSSSESSSSDDSSSEEEEGEIIDDTIKKKSASNAIADDSVVFISETDSNDFIPLNDGKNNVKPQNSAAPPAKTATKTHLYSDLFTRNEKKQLEVYNSNAYNPNAGEGFTAKKRPVIIDGSNVAFKHSLDKGFSVKGLKIAIEYFESMGHEVKAVIPQFRMNQNKSTDPAELDRLHKSGKIVQTPCKNLPGLTSTSYDDRFILQLACAMDAAIVSNDNYRDLLHENPAFKKIIETRVIGYTWCNDIFILPKDPYGKWGPTLDMILNRS